MVKFTGIEAERILSIFRKSLQTNEFILTEEERKFMLNGIAPESFNCFNARDGMMGYKLWALPMVLAPKYLFSVRQVRNQRLSNRKMHIYEDMNHQIFVNCLLAVWDGKISDKALLYASLIEAGHALKILPDTMFPCLSSWGAVSRVTTTALRILKAREEAKHEDLSQS